MNTTITKIIVLPVVTDVSADRPPIWAKGVEALTFSDINLLDSQGRSFEDSTDASIQFVDPQEHCVLEQLNPNLPKTCTKIFEVPLDANSLKAQVGDLDIFGIGRGGY